MAFGGNAGCSIVQKTQQMKFDGAHGNMLMLFATGISAAYGLIVYLKNHGNRGAGLATAKATTVFPIVAGICNVLLNLFVMILATTELSPSLIYPVLSVGGILITSVFSAAVFKEKLSWPQWLGVAIGAIAIALLSL
jgi:multidrug transporter EmrE-like cation transporter